MAKKIRSEIKLLNRELISNERTNHYISINAGECNYSISGQNQRPTHHWYVELHLLSDLRQIGYVRIVASISTCHPIAHTKKSQKSEHGRLIIFKIKLFFREITYQLVSFVSVTSLPIR